jgi:hypothetical protein
MALATRFDRAFRGAVLCLVIALLVRSAPYQGGQISELLKGIRGGHAEKEKYTPSVANCPGLFFPSKPSFPRGRKDNSQLNFLTSRHCVGYALDPESLRENRNGLTAQLNLAGPPCNVFGKDILNLTIQITYDTASR